MSNMFAILCFFLVLFPFAAGIVCWAVGRGGCFSFFFPLSLAFCF